jgi:spore germination protein YaaH
MVPPGKLVMGLPLYGRAWQDRNMNRALRYRQVEELLRNGKKPSVSRTESGPHFEYEDTVKVTVFYDDADSLLRKMRLYREAGVRAVSFWRIGQGSRELWRHLVPETGDEKSL